MTITKEKLKKEIENFPDVIEIDEIIDRLIFIQKLEERIEESDRKEVIDDADLKLEIAKWLQ